ncbi:ABC transporter ATP-binding protein [Cellulomonas sp. URHD0024]|uniref:ABC transporter ATP-binding protein n=1 Tax=Cellulomonas sp. URHD0024 TaxID=1302620 RepID=UPI00041FF946|nr:ABC transporter ATP-binding protein [Cellulomonas sp. URHD0024]
MSDVLLRAASVTRRFGDLTAVSDVSMQVGPGEVVGLLGANGAGKTTLMRMLLGLLGTTSGTVEVLGGPPTRERRRRLGYVPQNLGLYPDLTATENMRFAADSYRTPVPNLPADLARYAGSLVGELPLGAQRKLAFVIALSHDPEVLLLDEPTSGVDALSRSALWDTIREQSADGTGVLVTTHYMQEAQQCDRLLLMSDGQLVGQGSEADLIGATAAAAVRTDDWAAVFGVLNGAGVPVILDGRDVRVADADLDEVRRILAGAGLAATVEPVPATLEERMLTLARAKAR